MLPNRCVLAVALLVVAGPAMGQTLYQDIQREFADENQLQRDVRRYQHDVATGHLFRAAADRARIQNDESNIRYDQSLVQNDLAYPAQSLVPHPQYPGYFYYPSQPGQLYYDPNAQGQRPAPPPFVGPPAPMGPGGVAPVNVPASAVAAQNPNLNPNPNPNPVTFNVAPPSRTITVLISNPVETGVPINFAVEGTSYTVPSGYTQKLGATASSVVEFDRGDLFGDGRYRLSDGAYEFRYTDRGWELYKRPVKPPEPSDASTSRLPRNVTPRGVASAPGSTSPLPSTSPPPISDGQSPFREAVPPSPGPVTDPSVPR